MCLIDKSVYTKILKESIRKEFMIKRVISESCDEMQESFEMEEEMMTETGKCKGSCIKKVGNKWRVVSGKTGKLWSAHYDTKEDAQAGLDAYFANKR